MAPFQRLGTKPHIKCWVCQLFNIPYSSYIKYPPIPVHLMQSHTLVIFHAGLLQTEVKYPVFDLC